MTLSIKYQNRIKLKRKHKSLYKSMNFFNETSKYIYLLNTNILTIKIRKTLSENYTFHN